MAWNWRSWVRFRLRTLLVVVTLACLGLGWFVNLGYYQRRILASLAELKPVVAYDYQYDERGIYRPNAVSTAPQWLRRSLGEDGVADVVGVWLGREHSANARFVDDAVLGRIAQFKKLRALGLNFTNVTDEGLKKIAGLTELEYLYLSGTAITNEGVAHLAGMKRLKEVHLSFTRIDDGALEVIRGLPELKTVWLDGTAVTDAGLTFLESSRKLKSLHVNNTNEFGRPYGTRERKR
jgi:hypothetical protein